MNLQVVFFGSFQNFSVQVLDALLKTNDFRLIATVTTPPAPKGRHLHLTPNETQTYSEKHSIPCFALNTLNEIPSEISHHPPDFLVVAGYGKLIPAPWLSLPKIMAVNLHQSLLPAYSGRCPAEWAILNGEIQTGVTLIKMTAKFDAGPILAQRPLPISPDDTRLTLYKKLYDLGAELLIATLPQITSGQIQPRPQFTSDQRLKTKDYFYARQITRQDGFISWNEFNLQLTTHNPQLEQKLKAFAGWPGVWTTNPAGQRIKLIAVKPQVLIQEEGQNPKKFMP
jgi:methionyl-tRNA formyltransferase